MLVFCARIVRDNSSGIGCAKTRKRLKGLF